MNVIANENKGRTYQLYNHGLIDVLVKDIMFSESSGDTEVRQNCLGIIQKFTLRSEPQTKLIKLDVISWIINTFVLVKI
jgi:hypothetical protein